MIHQDCYNKYYTINYFNDHIEIEINFIPKNNFNKAKIYFDLVFFIKLIILLLNTSFNLQNLRNIIKKVAKISITQIIIELVCQNNRILLFF